MAVLCALGTVQPSFAQDPSADEATLNFVDAPIDSVVKAVGHFINTTFIIDPRVKGTISLVTEKPVDKAHAYRQLIAALRLQGYTVVVSDGFSKVLPEPDAKLQVGPAEVSSVKGDQIVTEIFHLNYESANNLQGVLRPLITPNNTINVDAGNNTIVITDYADNVKRMGKIIAALDGPTSADIDIVPIKQAIASDIATMINRLLEPSGGGGAPEAGKIILTADPRTNSILIKAPSEARANLAKSLIAKLDQPTTLPGNVHVVYLKNADAIKLAQTLRAVVSADSSASSSSSGSGGSQGAQQQPISAPTSPGSSSGSGSSGSSSLPPSTPSGPANLPTGGSAGFIQADQATNTLIITCSDPVYRNLRSVIDQLDARRAEVYIESLIVEVSDTLESELGVQFADLSGNANSAYRVGSVTGFSTGGNNLIDIAASTASSSSTTGSSGLALPGNGLTVGLFRQVAGQLTLGAIAHAVSSDAKSNILSMPNLITLDNEEATVIVGQNVPLITGSFTTGASGGSAGVNPFQTVDRKDIGIKLRVRPQISEGGTVKMQIYQESSSIDPNVTNAAGLITDLRSITTNVLVDDGQIIVLGGLIQDNVADTNEQVPGLGDLPLVGNLFKYRTRSRTKTNLMIFLRPIVIRNEEQSAHVTADRYDYMRSEQMGTQPAKSTVLQNYPAPVLPPSVNGQVGGSGLVKPFPITGANGGNGAGAQQVPADAPMVDLTKMKQ